MIVCMYKLVSEKERNLEEEEERKTQVLRGIFKDMQDSETPSLGSTLLTYTLYIYHQFESSASDLNSWNFLQRPASLPVNPYNAQAKRRIFRFSKIIERE